MSREGHVAVVVLNRPPHNFLSVPQVSGLADVLEELDADLDVRAVVLGAEGRSFCAGADMGGGGERGVDSPADLYRAAARLFDVTVPIVGAIQGPAIGGGLGLALVPDVRVTCSEARFCANFSALGFHQGFGLSVTLPALVGPSRAATILYSSRRFRGHEAVAMGLADECVSLDDVRDRALELATEMALNAPLALRSIKATLRLGLGDRVRDITQREAAEQARLNATEDGREGKRAVGERRPGRFVGR